MTVPGTSTASPAAPAQQWRRLALAVLRKSGMADEDTPAEAVDELLSVTTYDGIRVRPLYTADAEVPPTGAPGTPPFTRGARPATAQGWDIRQRHGDPDAETTNSAILADLDNGVSSLWLRLGPTGVPVTALPAALAGVYLDLADVILDAGPDTEAAADTLLALVEERTRAGRDGTDADSSDAVGGNLGADPLGLYACTGQAADLSVAVRLAKRCAQRYPRLRAVTIDATVYHDAGGSDAEELGCSLATAVAYLRALTARRGADLSLADALAQLEFRYAANADQFLTIAKFRAARRLWARVVQVCAATSPGGAAVGLGAQRQHAVTSAAMMTARDPWVNMLRTTLACFAAGVGGADAVTVAPFDAALGLPDGFARRIARNTQSLLLEESNVGRVTDPAGGSWYVERLTEDLATAAWSVFTEIERAGGMATALDSGLITRRLAATWSRRADNLAHRRDVLIGVSEFPNLAERRPVRTPYPVPATQPPTGPGASLPLPRHRYAEAFEHLRDRADAHVTHDGRRPTVFLATLGPLAAYTGRVSFAANLFAAGGIDTVVSGSAGLVAEVPGAGDEIEQTVAAFTASQATVACLCSSDKRYAADASRLAVALREAGAVRVWLAGKPGDYDGVDSYLYAGCDAIDVLDTTLTDLAVA